MRAAALVIGCLLLARCQVYDAELATGRGSAASASRTRAEPVDAGDRPALLDAGTRPRASPPEDAGDEAVPDGPAPRSPLRDVDAGPAEPSRTPSCGDGEVNGAEKCDRGIADGQPGACPRSCPALEPCAPRVLNGTGCQAECLLREVACESGDACCPGKCTRDNDRDCSAKCGDGIVQQSSGETCEDGSDTPCLSNADACDDADPCTQDMLMGSAANCNARCAHVASREVKPNDGCCPSGESANTDSDCKPRCGNNVREPGEECDGGPGCEPDCKLASANDQRRCLDGAKNTCERCACTSCTGTETACRLGAEAELCTAVVSCMQDYGCIGNPLSSCYCGPTFLCGLPYGPCQPQVEAAGKSTDFDALYAAMSDRDTPLGRAASADLCRVTRCLDACRE